MSVGGGAGLGSVKYIIKILPQHTSKEVPLQRNKERIGVTGETKECESTKLQACWKARWISLSEESCGVSCLNVACDKRNRHIEIIKCKNEKLDIDKHQTFLTCVLTPGLTQDALESADLALKNKWNVQYIKFGSRINSVLSACSLVITSILPAFILCILTPEGD